MDEQKQKFESYLVEQIAACRQRSKLLAEDGRMDEGNFEKIRANIYEIFKTIFSAAERVCGKDDVAVRRFFMEKVEQIPTSWTAAYEAAQQNGDVERMHMERIKLDAIREIRYMYRQIWGEAI